jgi:hypothetical protein
MRQRREHNGSRVPHVTTISVLNVIYFVTRSYIIVLVVSELHRMLGTVSKMETPTARVQGILIP